MKELQVRELKPIELPQLPIKPLVSVLVANYNYAKYIGKAIESALDQTYPNLEIIVCDDGSTDNSCKVVDAYVQKDSRVKLVRKQNGGVSSALNAAYRESSGEIICILDADDIWMPNKLPKVLEAFQSDSQCGFVIHNVIQIDGHGQFIKRTPMLSNLASGWMAPLALENGGRVQNTPPASALCFRREVTDLIFPINEVFLRNADGLILSLALLVTLIVPISEVLSMYRLHGANLTGALSATADAFELGKNELESIHREQKKFLKNVCNAEIAEKLSGLESSLTYLRYCYLVSRLKGAPKPESKEIHQQLVAHPQFGRPVIERSLLRWGEYLPNDIFAALFHFAYGSSQLKRLVKLIFEAVFNMGYTRR
jgi:glycosyltransferase involved in cell wall biosynthesis